MSDFDDDVIERSPNARRNAIIVVVILLVIGALAWVLTRSGGAQQGAPAGARRAGGGGAGGPAGGGGPPGGGGGGPGGGPGGRRPAATVGIAKVVASDIAETSSAIGTVQPIVVATVRPQLSGTIFSINFTEGQIVRKGQLLAQLDPRPYRLALSQAQANLARDEAQLGLANANLQRYRTLLAQDSIARVEVDTQAATSKQSAATVAADRAAVGTARLNLQYSSITAPVSGRVGLRQADIGNYVTPGDANGIAVITQTDPIDVSFALPQDQLQRLMARARGNALPVTARDQGGTAILAQGRFLTFDNQIDATTGTVKAKARFANPQGKLFPNQFVNVALLADTLQGVATIPVSAVRHGAAGDFVFVLQPDKKVKLTNIKTGPASGAQIAVLSGVAIGQTVITEGADNLDDGSAVQLPGDAPRGPRRNQAGGGFLSRLFGLGGGNAGEQARGSPAAGGNDAAAGGGNASGERPRRRRAENGTAP